MPKPTAPSSTRPSGAPLPSSGIFSAEWHRWRGATLHITLNGEPPFVARLDAVTSSGGPDSGSAASLTELDTAGRPIGVRTLPWPPSGSVRVLRAP